MTSSLIHMYMQSFFTVSTCLLSPWFLEKSSGDANTLRLVCLSIINIMFTNFSTNLPPLSYMHQVDIWIITCWMCIILSIPLLLVLKTKQKEENEDSFIHQPDLNQDPTSRKEKITSENMFYKFSRFLLPILFFIFNLFYWIKYCINFF
ncbi:UNVERIFIED_CONTAM: hypothetical protein NCL1_53664 [Trichonephila clavipes]